MNDDKWIALMFHEIATQSGKVICILPHFATAEGSKESLAHAMLIAAAPKLLEVLMAFHREMTAVVESMEEIETPCSSYDTLPIRKLLGQAWTAIREARGDSDAVSLDQAWTAIEDE